MIGDGFNRINRLEAKHYFNTAEQELQVYRTAMSQYQSDGAFNYYLNEEDSKARDHKKIEFRDVTVEGFVAESILHPIHEIFRRTSRLFMQRYLMSETEQYCQLHDQIKLIHSIYFLQGVTMPLFLVTLFESIDQDEHERPS